MAAADGHSAEQQVRAAVERLREHAKSYVPDDERTIAALLTAARTLASADTPLALRLRRDLHTTTGLSPEMIEWGLVTTFGSLQEPTLRALLATPPHVRASPHPLVAVALAGNLFAAAVRALLLPLLAGAHVIAKCAANAAALPVALKQQLDLVDPAVGNRLEVMQFSRNDHAATAALCAHANALSIYGDDATVETLLRMAPARCTIIPHGHGISAAYIGADQLATPETARQAAQRLALDVAAYDQHGCLSPHFAFVEPGATVTPREFARLLATEALPELARLLPPAQPTASERATAMQWRAVAAVRGELFDAATHAVSFEADNTPRPSPGGRLLSIYGCPNPAALATALAPFGHHLKSVGVAGSRRTRLEVAAALHRHSSAEICRSGEMQTPAFDAYADGAPPLEGLRQLRG